MIPTLAHLESMARASGEILRRGFGAHHQIDYKGAIDPVTEIDRLSEAYLLGEIREKFPQHKIVAEESGRQQGREGDVWYIDPLDGTVNYTHGLPVFCVSIGYERDGLLQLGVVYDPILDECFTAERGCGAWLNGERLAVSATLELTRSLLATGFPYDIRTSLANNLDNFSRFAVRAQAVRRLGSAALDICYVAAGRFDGYWELSLQPWDAAAGILIAREAGAVVSRLNDGGVPIDEMPLAGGDPGAPLALLVSNPAIHSQMQDVLGGN